MLKEYLEEFIDNRTEYDDDTYDAIHNYCDITVSNMKRLETMAIIDSCGGIIKCIKNYQNNFDNIDFNDDEYKILRTLCYFCIYEYINDNYTDAESDDDDTDIILIESNINMLNI